MIKLGTWLLIPAVYFVLINKEGRGKEAVDAEDAHVLCVSAVALNSSSLMKKKLQTITLAAVFQVCNVPTNHHHIQT